MGKTFDIQRVMLILKHDIMENGKTNIGTALGLYALTLLVFFISMLLKISDPFSSGAELWDSFKDDMSEYFSFFLVLMMMAFGTMIMKPMETKEKCIAYLMLPATRIEKFAARFVYVTAGSLLLTFAVVLLADLTRILIFVPVLHAPSEFFAPVFPALWSGGSTDSPFILYAGGIGITDASQMLHVSDFVGTLFTQSFFMLCGCIWHRNAFFKALAIMIAVPLVAVTLGSLILGIYVGYNGIDPDFAMRLWGISFERFLYFANVVLLLLTLLFWWLSCRKFMRKQIVRH